MSFEVTATKKRPQTFDHLAGQEFVVATLKNSVSSGRIAHAYLFSGPRGVGKTSAARILAKSLNCEQGPTEMPCGTCSNCTEITRGNSLDVIEIDGASNTSVNDVREIKDEVLFAPNSSRYKVYIIDEVHMLSNSAFNALLKTIEEPPPYIVFIFATTEVHKVPATIRSRCQQFNFRLIPLEIIKDSLRQVADEIPLSSETDALYWIAKEATGSLRDAYTLFDQVVSFSRDGITLETIREKLGLVGLDQMNEIAECLGERNTRDVLVRIDTILCQGVSVEQFLIDLAEYFRNILFIKQGITRESILGSTVDRYSGKLQENLSVQQIETALEMILGLYRNIRYSLNQRFELELLVSKLSLIQEYITPAEILAKIRALREELSGGAPVNEPVTAVPKGAAGKETPVPGPDKKALKSQLIESLKKQKLALSSALEKATSWNVEEEALTLVFRDTYSANLVRQEVPLVRQKIREITGNDTELNITLEEKSSPEQQEKEDDQITLVKKVFRGEIIQGE